MNTEMQTYQISESEIKTLQQGGIIPSGTPIGNINLFAETSRRYQLDPFKKEIFLTSYNSKKELPNGQETYEKTYSVIVGRDGLRVIAQRTGEFIGREDAKFDLKSDGSYKTASEYNDNELPKSCTVTVYRSVNGEKCAFTATVLFKEFSSGKQKWKTMPFQMISKVAESHALKKGFGGELGGLHIEEEKAAFEDDQMNAKPSHIQEWESVLEGVKNKQDLTDLYQKKKEIVNNNEDIRILFAQKKTGLQ